MTVLPVWYSNLLAVVLGDSSCDAGRVTKTVYGPGCTLLTDSDAPAATLLNVRATSLLVLRLTSFPVGWPAVKSAGPFVPASAPLMRPSALKSVIRLTVTVFSLCTPAWKVKGVGDVASNVGDSKVVVAKSAIFGSAARGTKTESVPAVPGVGTCVNTTGLVAVPPTTVAWKATFVYGPLNSATRICPVRDPRAVNAAGAWKDQADVAVMVVSVFSTSVAPSTPSLFSSMKLLMMTSTAR
mmetsp:Transcript_34842/g.87648  ORF Transcript_34842/g.87648 Transcript_34842/m.87648 type:complete len:240 (-) Transcript_34842:1954-2673(-)